MPTTTGDEVFAYLHDFVQNKTAVMTALASLPMPLRVYIPGVTPETAARLGSAILEAEPVSIADIVRRSRCVVHHGGGQLAAACIASGIPQVILSKELDNRIAGGFVAAHGLGETCWLNDATTEWIATAIDRACNDSALRDRCQSLAPDYRRRWFSEDAAAMIAKRVLDLLPAR
jgi:UDP:flavonoid glycosyltransferase YjiC (YdhE family)